MRIRRLSWAGIKVEVGGTTLVVDLLEDTSRLRPIMGEPRGPLSGVMEERELSTAAILSGMGIGGEFGASMVLLTRRFYVSTVRS